MTNVKNVETNAQSPIYTLEDRPTWDEYFLFLAFATAIRSDDCFIKHGAVIVHDHSHHIVGTGYNNTISGMDMDIVQPYNREARRPHMKHAEHNAILNCSVNPKQTGSRYTIYVTAEPCLPCLEDIIQFGIRRIVYFPRVGTITDDVETNLKKAQIVNNYPDLQLCLYTENNPWIAKGLELLNQKQ